MGAFKVRGGVNLLAQMNEAERARGLISASTGNHGQSIAYAGRLFGAAVRIVVPDGANPGNKVAAMRGLGADVIFHGKSFQVLGRPLRSTGAAAWVPVRALRERASTHRRSRDA